MNRWILFILTIALTHSMGAFADNTAPQKQFVALPTPALEVNADEPLVLMMDAQRKSIQDKQARAEKRDAKAFRQIDCHLNGRYRTCF